MYHTAGAIGTRGMLGLQQTGGKLITDLRAILKSFSNSLRMEGEFFFSSLWLETFLRYGSVTERS